MNVEVLTPETSVAGSAPCTMVRVPPARGWDAATPAPARSKHTVASAAVSRAGRARRVMRNPLFDRERECFEPCAIRGIRPGRIVDFGPRRQTRAATPDVAEAPRRPARLGEEADGGRAIDRPAALHDLAARVVRDRVGAVSYTHLTLPTSDLV